MGRWLSIICVIVVPRGQLRTRALYFCGIVAL
jgi:hypothetical protein